MWMLIALIICSLIFLMALDMRGSVALRFMIGMSVFQASLLYSGLTRRIIALDLNSLWLVQILDLQIHSIMYAASDVCRYYVFIVSKFIVKV